MADFQIHADYDNDGKISYLSKEYNLRNKEPGAILLPNIDIDARRLPATISSSAGTKLDCTQRIKKRSDNDLLPVVILCTRSSVSTITNIYISLTKADIQKVNIYNAQKQKIQPAIYNSVYLFPLSFSGNKCKCFMEAKTIPGSPLFKESLNINKNDSIITLSLIQKNNTMLTLDKANFTISPLIFINNTCPVWRIYICDLPGNQPSIKDMEKALIKMRKPGMLKKIPLRLNWGDSWLQDQFQVGYCQNARGWMYVLFHLSRVRSNFVLKTAKGNLAKFVRGHFPSRNFGLFEDFWKRKIKVKDIRGNQKKISLITSFLIYMRMIAVFSLYNNLLQKLGIKQSKNPGDFYKARLKLNILHKRYLLDLEKDISKEKDKDQQKKLIKERTSLQKQIKHVEKTFSLVTNGITINIDVKLTITLDSKEVNRLCDSLRIHDSLNYGGNIEISPPSKYYPLGTIFIGNNMIDKSGAMDPQLILFLAGQKKQPVFQFHTSWLSVQHIDEIIAFVPSKEHDFAIFRASPGIALKILKNIWLEYMKGIYSSSSTWEQESGIPSATKRPGEEFTRLTKKGNSPVTHLLRGKYWLHSHKEVSDVPLTPPRLYSQMVEGLYSNSLGRIKLPYVPGIGKDRYYPANIAVNEIIYFGETANKEIEKKYIVPIEKIIKKKFPQIPILPLPVIFDIFDKNKPTPTHAFTPNLVNMQVVNKHLLIPRPFGPKMYAKDAIRVLKKVLPITYQAKLNEKFIKKNKLENTYIWLNAPLPKKNNGIDKEISIIAEQFKGSFPKLLLKDIITKIKRANPKDFNLEGDLRSGWRRILIPDKMLDMFELYTQILAESLGLKVQWIDSWFYHTSYGGLHCGTNVIRKPDVKKKWWKTKTYQPFEFRKGDLVEGKSPAK